MVRHGAGAISRGLESHAAEPARAQLDCLVAGGHEAALALKGATTHTPIAGVGIGDPRRYGLTTSQAAPDGNITGVGNGPQDAKRVETLKESFPHVSEVAFLVGIAGIAGDYRVEEAVWGGQAVGVEVVPMRTLNEASFSATLDAFVRDQFDGLLVGNNSVLRANQALVRNLTAQQRLPAIYVQREYVVAGGLMSLKNDPPPMQRAAARMVHKLLQGARVSEVPFDLVPKMDLVINLRTARASGFTIPPSVLGRATEVLY